MPNKEVPSIVDTELTDQIDLQNSWGKEEYRESIYQIQYKGCTISFLPFERIDKKHDIQLDIFQEHVSLHKPNLAVIEYLPSSHQGLIRSRSKGYYDKFEQYCIKAKVARGDFDLVRNNAANITYQLISFVKPTLESSYMISLAFKEKYTRRDFLKITLFSSYVILVNVLPLKFGNKTQSSTGYIIPNLVRTANIAQNIVNYIESNKNQKISVLYPPVHAAYIRYFIEHPIARNFYYSIGASTFPKSASNPIISTN